MGATRRIKTKRRTRLVALRVINNFPCCVDKLYQIRDYDQIRQDLATKKHLQDYKATKDVEDLPGLGQHYCVECAKWFETEHNLVAHRKGKNHKRR